MYKVLLEVRLAHCGRLLEGKNPDLTSLNRAQMKQNLSFSPEGEDGICLLQSFAQISARVQVE